MPRNTPGNRPSKPNAWIARVWTWLASGIVATDSARSGSSGRSRKLAVDVRSLLFQRGFSYVNSLVSYFDAVKANPATLGGTIHGRIW